MNNYEDDRSQYLESINYAIGILGTYRTKLTDFRQALENQVPTDSEIELTDYLLKEEYDVAVEPAMDRVLFFKEKFQDKNFEKPIPQKLEELAIRTELVDLGILSINLILDCRAFDKNSPVKMVEQFKRERAIAKNLSEVSMFL